VSAYQDVFKDGKVTEKSDVLEGSGQAVVGDDVWGQAFEVDWGTVSREKAHIAPGGFVNAGDTVKESGLARAIGADQGGDRIPLNR
jgi:hypothetical protein